MGNILVSQQQEAIRLRRRLFFRRKAARALACFLPRQKRQKFVYDRLYENDLEAVTHPLLGKIGRLPDFVNGPTYSEKMRSLWLTHPNPLMSLVTDKAAARDYIDLCGVSIKPPDLLGVYENPYDLDLSKLPERCYLKITDGCKKNILHSPENPNDTKTVQGFSR